jgi:hypothetical protein
LANCADAGADTLARLTTRAREAKAFIVFLFGVECGLMAAVDNRKTRAAIEAESS